MKYSHTTLLRLFVYVVPSIRYLFVNTRIDLIVIHILWIVREITSKRHRTELLFRWIETVASRVTKIIIIYALDTDIKKNKLVTTTFTLFVGRIKKKSVRKYYT